MAPHIVLRPFLPEETAVVWAARRRRGAPGTPASRRQTLRIVERSGSFDCGLLSLAIECDGRLVGDVQARRPEAFAPPGVVEVGIDVFEDADRGRGIGTAAIDLLLERLFREDGAQRIQASTALDNEAMRRVLEKLGFSFEGTLRGFMPTTDGAREDYALYAITRRDWQTATK